MAIMCEDCEEKKATKKIDGEWLCDDCADTNTIVIENNTISGTFINFGTIISK
jgi:ribosomal protein L37AE/L43A